MTTMTHHEAAPTPTPDRKPNGLSEKALKRLVTLGCVLLVVLLAVFGVLYYFGQRGSGAPTLIDRQVSAAENAVKAAPRDVGLRVQLAAVYQDAGRLDDAAAQFTEVLKAVPANTPALLGLGTVKMAQGDLDGAKGLFAKIAGTVKKDEFAGVDPEREAAHYWLATIALKQQQLPTAISEATAALKIDDSDADAWFVLGQSQSAQGDDKTAVTNISRALAFVPTGWCEPYAALQTSYSKLSKPEMAEYAGAMSDFCAGKTGSAESRLEALTSGPAAGPAMLGLGLAYESTNDETAALAWYRKALKADPNNTAAQTAIGRLTAATGTTGTAGTTPQAEAK